MTGIDYPAVSVGGHENLTVRYSLAAQLLLRRRGIDPLKIGVALAPVLFDGSTPTAQPNSDAVRNYITVFSCMVAEHFVDLSKPGAVNLDQAPTADYWATQIDDFSVIETAVNEALKKALEERRKKLALVPPAEQAS
jgi:hypothetical protein